MTRQDILEQLQLTASVRLTGRCTWQISGHFTDAEGEQVDVKITTHDEELAAGWKDDPYNANTYNDYEKRWGEALFDSLDLDEYNLDD